MSRIKVRGVSLQRDEGLRNLHAELDTSRILERRPGLLFPGTGAGLANFHVCHGVIVFGRFDSRRDDGTSSKTPAIFIGPAAGIVDTSRGLGIPFGGAGRLPFSASLKTNYLAKVIV